MIFEIFGRKFMKFGQETLELNDAAGDITTGCVDLDPVAGRNDDRFGDGRQGNHPLQRILHRCRGECNLFPYVYRGRFMTEAHNNNIHAIDPNRNRATANPAEH